jgi:hypothetical protein
VVVVAGGVPLAEQQWALAGVPVVRRWACRAEWGARPGAGGRAAALGRVRGRAAWSRPLAQEPAAVQDRATARDRAAADGRTGCAGRRQEAPTGGLVGRAAPRWTPQAAVRMRRRTGPGPTRFPGCWPAWAAWAEAALAGAARYRPQPAGLAVPWSSRPARMGPVWPRPHLAGPVWHKPQTLASAGWGAAAPPAVRLVAGSRWIGRSADGRGPAFGAGPGRPAGPAAGSP